MLVMIFVIDSDDRVIVEKLYKNHQSEMRYVAYCILKDSSDAEAAVQEAFLRIMNRIDSLKAVPEDKRPGYCFTAVRNVALNLQRKSKNMQIIFAPMDDVFADKSEDLETMLIRQEDMALLREKVEQLKPDYKRPLLLRFGENLHYKDIAILLGISDALARKRVQRGVDKLLQLYREEGFVDA